MRRLAFALIVAALPWGCSATLDNAAAPDAHALPGDGGSSLDAPMAMPDLSVGPPCGSGFCAVGQVCELGTCHLDCGASGVRCGKPEACCASGQVCYLGACTTPGASCSAGTSDGGVRCMPPAPCPSGQYCEASLGHCLPLAQTVMCEYHPPTGPFSPVVKWEWQGSSTLPTYNQVMMTPMVADLDGDCLPDVVFSTFAGGNYSSDGVLRAVRGDGSGELWNVTDASQRVVPGGQVALGDVDGDGKVEVFACHQSHALVAFRSDGSLYWMGSGAPCGSYDAPSLADVDHDGVPEVVVGFSVFEARDGSPKNTPPTVDTTGSQYGGYGFYTTVAELDGDDTDGMEIAGGGAVYHWDGTPYWDHASPHIGYAAVGDLDGDMQPEVVAVQPDIHMITAYHHDGSVMWGPVDVNNGVAAAVNAPAGGGPPTIADFDGNGQPDVATAGGYGYLVLVGQTGAVLWQNTDTRDVSSRVTGSSVFDFQGDGVAEAIYNDEHNLRVYDGPTGTVLLKLCSTSGTLWENPVVVDVDGDDHAEIVVMDNNYAIGTCDDGSASHTGFKVIGDAMNRWVRTRRLWNQHTYHVTNVADDGTIPRREMPNWKQPGLDDFRQNVQTKNLLAAPDLVPEGVGFVDQCQQGTIQLVATVVNQGAATAPAGVPVTFYLVTGGAPQAIATVHTTTQLLAGASEAVSATWMVPLTDAGVTSWAIYVVVDDDGTGMGVVNECDETNNQSPNLTVGCMGIG